MSLRTRGQESVRNEGEGHRRPTRIVGLGLLGALAALAIGYGIADWADDTGGNSVSSAPVAEPTATDLAGWASAHTVQPAVPDAHDAVVGQAIDAFLLEIGKSPSVDILREQPLMSPNSPLVSSTYYRVDGYDLYLYSGPDGARRVVEYGVGAWQAHETPPAVPTSDTEALDDDEMLALARQLVLAEAGLSSEDLDSLAFSVGDKGADRAFFRWEDSSFSLADRPKADVPALAPIAQVGMTQNGFIFNYMNYLAIPTSVEGESVNR